MVECVPEEEGTCEEGELCVAHNIHTDETEEFAGNYCALEDDCQTYVVDDYGRDLYVTCPWTTRLVACSDDDICTQQDAGTCYQHWLVDSGTGQPSSYDGDYCATECGGEVSDLGKSLLVQCPEEQVFVECTVGGDECTDEGSFCATYSYPDGANLASVSYCAVEETCDQAISYDGRELTMACQAGLFYECTNGGCQEQNELCSLLLIVEEDGSQVNHGQFCVDRALCNTEIEDEDLDRTYQVTCQTELDALSGCTMNEDCQDDETVCAIYENLSQNQGAQQAQALGYCTDITFCNTEVELDEMIYLVTCLSQDSEQQSTEEYEYEDESECGCCCSESGGDTSCCETVDMSLTLDWTLAEFEEAGGEDAFAETLAKGLGVEEDQVIITSVTAGSVVVDASIVVPEGEDADAVASAANDAVAGGAVDFGAPVLDFAAGGEQVIAGGEVVLEGHPSYGEVLTVTPENSADAIGGISEDDIQEFLCDNYLVGLHQQLNGQELQSTYMACALVEKQDGSYRLHHSLGETSSDLTKLVFNRNEMRSHYLSFEPQWALKGLELSSQHLLSSVSGIDDTDDNQAYSDAVSLFFNNDPDYQVNVNRLSNVELKLRGEVHNYTNTATEERNLVLFGEPGRVNQIGLVTVIPTTDDRRNLAEDTLGHYAMLRFDFFQTTHTYEYYDISDAGRDCVIVAAFLFGIIYLLGALCGVCFFHQFFVELGQLIVRKYQDAQEWKEIQKLLSKFRQIHAAMVSLDQFKDILAEISAALDQDFAAMTYQQTSEALRKMKLLDNKLPNIDDIEIEYSKFEQNAAQKARNADIDAVIEKRAQLTVSDVIALVKERVSIFGVYKLHDELQMQDLKLQSEVRIQNAKLEFLYQSLAKRISKRKK